MKNKSHRWKINIFDGKNILSIKQNKQKKRVLFNLNKLLSYKILNYKFINKNYNFINKKCYFINKNIILSIKQNIQKKKVLF